MQGPPGASVHSRIEVIAFCKFRNVLRLLRTVPTLRESLRRFFQTGRVHPAKEGGHGKGAKHIRFHAVSLDVQDFPSARMRKLSDEERHLLERYRALSEEDRNAMCCLLNVMEGVSRF